MLGKIKSLISGKKSYLLAATAIVGAVVAWSTGGLSDIQTVYTVFGALQSAFLRAGIAKTTAKAAAKLANALNG